MNKLNTLRNATTLTQFATLLGYKASTLTYIIYKLPEQFKYNEFSIPKRNGNSRVINAPHIKLKKLQRRLSDLLSDCYEEIHQNENRNKRISHGFMRKCSIITNASNHKNKRYVFNCDLQDFFPSINFGRVRGFFIKNNHFKLDEKIATILAQIACHDNKLPQGSPCSPIISNLIGHILDIRMVNLAKKSKCTYSRYVDDITFSTNKREFPQQIAVMEAENRWSAGKPLIKEIARLGFKINTDKISMQYKISRQITTGLIVNKKINVKREYYKKARSMCHQLFKTNIFYISKKITEDDKSSSQENDQNIYGSLKQLEGVLGFINYINKPIDDRELNDKQYRPKGLVKLTRQFLFYKHFFALQKPLIVCEGKTDITYIKSAILSLKDSYIQLFNHNDKSVRYNISFLNLSNYFKRIFEMSSGTSGIKQLIIIYDKYIQLYKGEGIKYPVIIVLDNDEGSKEIKSTIIKKLNLSTVLEEKIYNICENLFVIFANEKANTEIEDLFEDKILQIKIDGKSFNRKKEINTHTDYGKHIFAERIIKLNQKKINFNGFRPLLDKINVIIEDYKKRIV